MKQQLTDSGKQNKTMDSSKKKKETPNICTSKEHKACPSDPSKEWLLPLLLKRQHHQDGWTQETTEADFPCTTFSFGNLLTYRVCLPKVNSFCMLNLG